MGHHNFRQIHFRCRTSIFEFAIFDFSTFDLPNFDLSVFDISRFPPFDLQFPKFGLQCFGLPDFALPDSGLPSFGLQKLLSPLASRSLEQSCAVGAIPKKMKHAELSPYFCKHNGTFFTLEYDNQNHIATLREAAKHVFLRYY